ncbi:hypothetical protein GCM10012278_88170 [Nonomuraea glycinis]|uniref:Tn3 transposase DDE domain-containing protein n=1 Tax=Nonomuraea glycinis TaxID=2047744 RepID=A0A918AHS7_9ACTN|nr:Tn3 family transposase [Nonomuraea glycinis]GGP17915.1 hypothetical protein GCM10012278_88170 [Nonomuraea glycinis]
MLKVGRAQRTVFLARWLRDRDLQRETESGLNMVEDMTPYGQIQLRTDRRLDLTRLPTPRRDVDLR